MTEDHEPINPTIHAHLIGLGYVHVHDEGGGWTRPESDHYYREVETDTGVTWTGMMVDCYRDNSIRIGGKPDAHTPDLLRFLADVLGGEK